MTSDEFNKLSNTDKLLCILYDSPILDPFDMSTINQLGRILDNIKEADDENNRVALIQFLNEKDRARGCKWCGG